MARKRKVSPTLLSQEEMERMLELETVIKSQVLQTTGEANITKMGRAEDGGVWFKDEQTGTCYRIVMQIDGIIVVAETRDSKKPVAKPKAVIETHVTIKCVDCGDGREIAVQDRHQVTRCKPCQKKFRANKRAIRAKAIRAEKRRVRELAGLNGKDETGAEPIQEAEIKHG